MALLLQLVPCLCFQLISVSSFEGIAESQLTMPIECGDQIPGDTFNSIDGSDYYSFAVSTNISLIWFSSCGSDFDTFLSIQNSSKTTIASNDNSIACGEQAIVQMTRPSIDTYTLSVSGKHATDVGAYVISMICTEYHAHDPSYPSRQSECNHVYNKPVDVCLTADNDTEPYWSHKYICNERNEPLQQIYLSNTHCNDSTPHFNVSLPVNGSHYNCDAATVCGYAAMQYALECVNENESDSNANGNSMSKQEWLNLVVITDVCLAEHVSWSCDAEKHVLTKHLYEDAYCEESSVFGNLYAFKPGCYVDELGDYVYIENITCFGYEYGEEDDDGVPVNPNSKYVLLWLLCSGCVLCTVFGVVYCRKKKRQQYKQQYQQHKLVNSFQMMPVSSTQSNDGDLVYVNLKDT